MSKVAELNNLYKKLIEHTYNIDFLLKQAKKQKEAINEKKDNEAYQKYVDLRFKRIDEKAKKREVQEKIDKIIRLDSLGL